MHVLVSAIHEIETYTAYSTLNSTLLLYVTITYACITQKGAVHHKFSLCITLYSIDNVETTLHIGLSNTSL